MKKQKGKSRATHVAGDMRKQRLQSLLRVCVALLLPTLYLFYCLSGLYIIDVENDEAEGTDCLVPVASLEDI